MELRQLEHFVGVARERNFTRAAGILHISQSGLSASIRALEETVGAPLLVRTTKRVELTPAGAAFLLHAQRTLDSAQSARDAVDAIAGVVTGPVRIGSESCPGVIHLASDLAAFGRAYPDVELRLLVGGSVWLTELIARGDLDLAFVVPTGAAPAGVQLTRLGTERMVALSHPDRAFHEPVGLAELARHPFVDFSDSASSRVLNRRAFATVGHDYRVRFEVNDVHTLLDLVAEDLAIAVVPQSIAAKRAGQLRATTIGDPLPEWAVCIATGGATGPAVDAVLSHFQPD